ncbi:hypothetical protein [Pseudoneobacillus rhizosphaerae]|jgi:succinylarginine dihydrolase|uniref:Uncharacterized protein n=1 Tax=Pseudoneobacillus rhizosphaerae TaxID=2880968 RepID=A0A9C7G6Z7_9BACI|nr:hypothetical protein [Pseudoneobacillus rhizosphaerae]CAG9607114.1 hypothetical protein NEOCIP111885_00804 [Pseudoneobacillus rhizosphaerae]
MLNRLVKYKERQTIINEYHDDELVNRCGFHFDKIQTDNNSILFMKECKPLRQIDLPAHFKIRKDSQFPNFYVVEWDVSVIEIYFP